MVAKTLEEKKLIIELACDILLANIHANTNTGKGLLAITKDAEEAYDSIGKEKKND